MNIIKKYMENDYLVSLFSKCIIALLGIFNSVLIYRYLGVDLKGEYAYYLNIINILAVILNLGIYQGFPYFMKTGTKKVKLKEEFLSIILIQFIIYLFLVTLFCKFFMVEFLMLSFVLCAQILNNQMDFILLIDNFKKRVFVNIISSISNTLLLLSFFIFVKESSIQNIYICILAKDIIGIILRIKMYNVHIIEIVSHFKISMFWRAIKFGFIPMITTLLITLNYKVDVLILKRFTDYANIGLYSTGVALAGQLWIVPDAFKDVLFNRTAKNNAKNEICLSIKINVCICIIITILFIFFGKIVIIFLYGLEFADSYFVALITIIGIIPMVYYKMIYPLFISDGRRMQSILSLSIAFLFNIVLNFLLIPQYGINGSAFSSVISYSICGLFFCVKFMGLYKVKFSQLFIINMMDLKKIRNIRKSMK